MCQKLHLPPILGINHFVISKKFSKKQSLCHIYDIEVARLVLTSLIERNVQFNSNDNYDSNKNERLSNKPILNNVYIAHLKEKINKHRIVLDSELQ